MSNKALEDYLEKNHIKLLRSNVGDKYVLEVMKENDLNFGGEQSGSYNIFRCSKNRRWFSISFTSFNNAYKK